MNDYPTHVDIHGENLSVEDAVLRGLIAIDANGNITKLTGKPSVHAPTEDSSYTLNGTLHFNKGSK